MTTFQIILLCSLIPVIYALIYVAGSWNVLGKCRHGGKSKKDIQKDFDQMYSDLWDLLQDLRVWYSIDRANSSGIYVWTKGEDSEDLFDILPGEIVMRDKDYVIPDEVKSTVFAIQEKLYDINNYWKKKRSTQ